MKMIILTTIIIDQMIDQRSGSLSRWSSRWSFSAITTPPSPILPFCPKPYCGRCLRQAICSFSQVLWEWRLIWWDWFVSTKDGGLRSVSQAGIYVLGEIAWLLSQDCKATSGSGAHQLAGDHASSPEPGLMQCHLLYQQYSELEIHFVLTICWAGDTLCRWSRFYASGFCWIAMTRQTSRLQIGQSNNTSGTKEGA